MEPLVFVSLKIKEFSLESLNWVLASLRSDEMTPFETAIKNRIKEAFLLKIEASHWSSILDAIVVSSSTKLSFKLVEVAEDQTDFQDSYVIYLAKEEPWYGVDSSLSGVSIDPVLYGLTKDFLRVYFNHESGDSYDEAFVDLIDDEVRAIPGGRYGCT